MAHTYDQILDNQTNRQSTDMKFKTNASCQHCQATILKEMNSRFPNGQWSMDLNDADKVLEVHGIPEDAVHAAQVEAALAETGFKGSWIQQ